MLGALRAIARPWHTARMLSSARPVSITATLARIARLKDELRNTLRPSEKNALLSRNSDLGPLLMLVLCGPPCHVSSSSVLKRMAIHTQPPNGAEDDACASLDDLFRALQCREVTGHNALDAVCRVLRTVRLHDTDGTLEGAFMHLLDRDLRAGVGPALLRRAFGNTGAAHEAHSEGISGERHVVLAPHEPREARRTFPQTDPTLPVALGVALQKAGRVLEKSAGERWLISRKLDGVRCLVRLKVSSDCAGDPAPSAEALGPKQMSANCNTAMLSVEPVSRAGRPLALSQSLIDDIRAVASKLPLASGKTLYIDGELCVFAPGAEESHAGSKEDFSAAISAVRGTKGGESVRLVAFDLFDPSDSTTILSERLKTLSDAVRACGAPLTALSVLEQTPTTEPAAQIPASLDACRAAGWEGLIVRRDAPHAAKRTRDILKVKDFYEAEYAVEDWRTERMAVAQPGGVMRDEEMLSAVMVRHGPGGRTAVWVGSGLSLAERRRYAIDPEALRGAIVTVRYFAESVSRGRGAEERSLRFPTLKAIYPRDEHPRGRDL